MGKTKLSALMLALTVSAVLIGFLICKIMSSKNSVKVNISTNADLKLDIYSYENLSKYQFQTGKISINELISDNIDSKSYYFAFSFNPNLDGKSTKVTTGLINIPVKNSKNAIIVMIRGYIDKNKYRSGDGTRNTALYFANNGYITIAPDFLGYGKSDPEADNIFEARFQTYTTILSLIKTLDTIKNQPDKVNGDTLPKQSLINAVNHIFIWGHSNGGQIALSTLEISGVNYPTILWAPVTKPFPYSILYYTDDVDDGGRYLRSELAKFEAVYDSDKYSLTNYFDRLNAPIQFNQGSSDDTVPQTWTDSVVSVLKKKGKDVTYEVYPGANHDMRPVWDKVVVKNLDFYNNYLN